MKNIFNEYYKKYDQWYDRNPNVFLSEIKAVKKLLPETGKGLEIGVGTGRFASALNISNGIDPAENMVKIARQRGVDVCVGEGERLPYKEETFNYVLIVITLCFVRDPLQVLKQAHKVLKEKGRIIAAIVDRDSFLGEFYQGKKSVFYKKARFFSVSELSELLDRAGFNNMAYFQTISKIPEHMNAPEEPQKGFGQGGFVAAGASKS